MTTRTLYVDGPDGTEHALRYDAEHVEYGHWDITFLDPIPDGMSMLALRYEAAWEADDAYYAQREAAAADAVDAQIDGDA